MIGSFKEMANKLFLASDIRSFLLKGSGGAFIINIISAALAFGVQVLLARLLGANSYGDYIYVISWITLLTLFGKLGIDTASLRYISEYYVQERWELLAGFLKRSLQIVLICSVVFALITSGVIFFFWDYFGDNLGSLFLLATLLLPFNSLLEVGGTFLRGFKYVIVAIAPRAILHPLMLAIGVVLIFSLAGDASPSSAVAINIVASLITLLITLYYLFKVLPSATFDAKPKYLTKEWLTVAFPLLLISGLHLILIRTDTLMVGALAGTADAGIYSAASRVTEIMLFGQNSVMFIFAPMISELFSKGDKAELQRMVTLASRVILAISLTIGISLIFPGKFILSLFGEAFTAGYPALVVLIFGQLIFALVSTAGWLLSMTGYQKENAVITGLNVIVNIILNAVLIPYWGLVGAAIATAIAITISNISLAYLVWKRLNIIPLAGIFKF